MRRAAFNGNAYDMLQGALIDPSHQRVMLNLPAGDHVADHLLAPPAAHVDYEARASEEGEGWISGGCGARGAVRLNVDADGWIRCGSG